MYSSSATATVPKDLSDFSTERLSRVIFLASELSNSRLREIENAKQQRWTKEKRAEKSRLAKIHRPWNHSTGPKTDTGKARSSLNAYKHGMRSGAMLRLNHVLRAQLYFVRWLDLKETPPQKHCSTYPVLLQRRMEKLDDLMRRMRLKLEAAGVETPALDARILVRQGGNFSDSDLITLGQAPLSNQLIEIIEKNVDRRMTGEPVSRVLGEREFWGLPFKISPATLDPRPDTETLVSAALKRAREMKVGEETGLAAMASAAGGSGGLRILDLGTGSGCILISLLTELPDATGVGVDLNPDAITMARQNADALGVGNRVVFHQGSWFDALPDIESFDIIVSNPPYIPESDIESLAVEVRNHDPILALVGGKTGLDPYKIIVANLKKHLACDGFTLFEIGRGQEKDLARLVEESNMRVGESYADLGGILRVVEITHGEN